MQQLLIIDPQNDFCDIPGAALPVPGACADMARLAGFVRSTPLDAITVTLDSHPPIAVERTTFWQTARGEAPAAFTFVTEQDVASGQMLPRDVSLVPKVIAMLQQLAARGRPGLVIWPVHCVTGTWGHGVYEGLAQGLAEWSRRSHSVVRNVQKGEYPLTEHFGVFEADAPDADVPSTLFNTALAQALTQNVDTLFIAGEASSHCVAASFDQLAGHLTAQGGLRPRVVVLTDCMSPVGGFEASQDAFFDRARAWGAQTMTAAQATLAFGPGVL